MPTPSDIAARLNFAQEIARAAGALLKAKLGTNIGIRYKDVRRNLVTEADTESEALIREKIGRAYPDDAILGEESGETGDPRHGLWIVDPLDGTTNYAHGYRFFSVSIAYQAGKTVPFGVVYDPMAEEMFHAAIGGGAWCNGGQLDVSDCEELIDALLVTGFSAHRIGHPLRDLEPFRDFMRSAQAIRRDGSAALDLCYVAAGRLDGFWERGLHAWDIAAGKLILEEAGGRVTDYRGDAMVLDAGQLAASNARIHSAMIAVLKKYAE